MRYKELIPIVNDILDQYDFALTVRQIYYRLISDPYILFENTRSNYNGFDRILTKAREEEEIDWTRIEDRTRQSIGGEEEIADETPEDFLQAYIYTLKNCWQYYDKKMWTSQKTFLEVWVEKDALSSLVSQACKEYRVLVFPSRGFSSFTKVKEGIKRLYQNTEIIPGVVDDPIQNKPTYVLHLADHDPSGLGMTQDLKNRFSKYDAGFIVVERIGLNIDQVREFDLRPNPVKKADSRTAEYVQTFGNDCWELDALPPNELQKLIVTETEGYIDQEAWEATEKEIEQGKVEIKEKLKKIMDSFIED
jgi:hypothetical protein